MTRVTPLTRPGYSSVRLSPPATSHDPHRGLTPSSLTVPHPARTRWRYASTRHRDQPADDQVLTQRSLARGDPDRYPLVPARAQNPLLVLQQLYRHLDLRVALLATDRFPRHTATASHPAAGEATSAGCSRTNSSRGASTSTTQLGSSTSSTTTEVALVRIRDWTYHCRPCSWTTALDVFSGLSAASSPSTPPAATHRSRRGKYVADGRLRLNSTYSPIRCVTKAAMTLRDSRLACPCMPNHCEAAERDHLGHFRGSLSTKMRNPPRSRTATVRIDRPGGYMTHQGALTGFAHLRVGVSVSHLCAHVNIMLTAAYHSTQARMPVSPPTSLMAACALKGLLPNSHLGTPPTGETSSGQLRKCHQVARQPFCNTFFCIKSTVTARERILSTQGCGVVGPPPDKRTIRYAKSYSTCICAGHRHGSVVGAHYTNEASAT